VKEVPRSPLSDTRKPWGDAKRENKVNKTVSETATPVENAESLNR